MSVPNSVRSNSPAQLPEPLLAAIVYPNEAYPHAMFERLVDRCRARGLRLAGAIQHPAGNAAATACDVIIEDVMTGWRTALFEDRGPGATGCRLDTAALADVAGQIERSLDSNPGLLLLNKFGKVEAEGGGLIGLIAMALERGIAVVIGVPVRHLDSWREFAGDLSLEFSEDLGEIADWLDRRASCDSAA